MRICQFKKSGKCLNKECTGQRKDHRDSDCPYKTLWAQTPERKAYKKAYYEDHAEEVHQKYIQNLEENRERNRQYSNSHKEERHAYNKQIHNVIKNSLRHHVRKGMNVEVTLEEALEVYRATPYCRYCGRTMAPSKGVCETSVTLDRIDNGNTLRKDNIQFVCHQCNLSKSNRTHDEYVAYMRNVLQNFNAQ